MVSLPPASHFSRRVIPQLREFAAETGKRGVYVTNVEAGTPANKAGLKVGDIVTAVGDHEIDQNGNYVDPLVRQDRVYESDDSARLRGRYRSGPRST